MSMTRKYTRRKTLLQRFEEKYKIASNGCWVWSASSTGTNRAVMMVTMEPGLFQKKYGSHVAWFLTHGEWPEKGLVAMHSCDNGMCVNPEHLTLGTQKQNMKERTERSESWNRHSKFTAEQVRQIRASDLTQIELATKYQVSQTAICNLLNGKTYRWV